MRQLFGENLRILNKAAIDEKRDGETERIAKVVDWLAEKRAAERGSDKDAQKEIFTLQKKKQAVMDKLRESLSLLDDPNRKEKRADGSLFVMEEDGRLVYRHGNKSRKLSIGEIMTDGDWGLDYHLDRKTVPRNIRKRYLLETAKRELLSLLDEQIIIDESSSGQVHEFKREAYKRIRQDRKSETTHAGLIAEKMVENFLKKLGLDYGVDFEIIKADVYQDVENKVDFIIRRQSHNRGAKVEASEENIGIQFTISTAAGSLKNKDQQVKRAKTALESDDHIKDIVLISMPLGDVLDIYRAWEKKDNAKKIGGPDKLWPPETKEKIFKGVMQKIFNKEEIDEQWARIAGRS